MIKHLGFILGFIFLSTQVSNSQIQIDNTTTPDEIVALLVGTGISFSNVTFSGDMNQFGSFDENGANLGIAEGVILGTGDVELAEGPNNAGGSGLGGGNFGASDPDLEIVSGVVINDVAILEFDFVPLGDVVSFYYVFGSEEYNEYVCGTVNDAFGFFLSGPGITGAFSSPGAFPNGSTNIALVPGGDIGVSIGTVNNGTAGFAGNAANCAALDPNWQSNSIYFNDNTNGTTIQYDGMTVVMEATHSVECGETYHIKIAIGDGGDTVFDSGVFLEENSFSSNVPASINLNIVQATDIENGIYENCGGAVLEFSRENNIDTELTIDLNYTGTAINGTDYDLPSSITFNANQTSLNLLFDPVQDEIVEVLENVVMSITFSDVCGNVQEVELVELFIVDVTPLSLTTEDLLVCGEDEVNLFPEVNGGIEPYSYLWSTTQITNAIAVPTDGPLTYSVSITDVCISPDVLSGEFNLIIPEAPNLTYPPNELSFMCEDSISVFCVITGDFVGITYSTQDGTVIGTTNPMIFDTSIETDSIFVGIIDQCNATNEIVIPINRITPPELLVDAGEDIVASCIEVNNLIGDVQGGEAPYEVSWEINGEEVSDILNYSLVTGETLEITFTATDHCDQVTTDEISIIIPQIPIILNTTEDIEICRFEEVILSAQATGGEGGFIYSWEDFGIGQTQSVTANDTATYFITVYDICGKFTTNSVHIDVIDFLVETEVTHIIDNTFLFESETFPPCDTTCFYTWFLGDNSSSFGSSLTHTYEEYNSHSGYLTVTNQLGCKDSSFFTVYPPLELFIPNSFTPNNDGVNDIFKAYGIGVNEFHIRIFNRSGAMVYESRDINEGWIGELSDKFYYAPNNVYSYIATARGYDTKHYEWKGFLMIIR